MTVPARHIIETPETREARLTHERALLAEAEQAVADGRFIVDEDVDRWLDGLHEDAAPSPVATKR